MIFNPGKCFFLLSFYPDFFKACKDLKFILHGQSKRGKRKFKKYSDTDGIVSAIKSVTDQDTTIGIIVPLIIIINLMN